MVLVAHEHAGDRLELIDIEALLQPISDGAPCGPSLEYDADYIDLENAARRKPETEIGGVVTPAAEPDWRVVEKAAIDLFSRSKDAQIVILMTEALTHNHGEISISPLPRKNLINYTIK